MGEIQAGLQKLHYPPNYAYRVFTQLDKDKDEKISYDEFKGWVEMKQDDMQELFDSVDTDKSGHICLKELKVMLYHLDLPTKDATVLMKNLDKDGDSPHSSAPSSLIPNHIFWIHVLRVVKDELPVGAH